MFHFRFPRLLAVLLLAPVIGHAATQSVVLKPGWNSVWLTVDPADPKPATVFASLPVAQVWCWFPTETPVEFIDNPNKGLFNRDGWHAYIPDTQPNAFLSNLGAIQAHRPYLIKLEGKNNATLTVHGPAAFKPLKWRADSFNLVGFHVDPALGGGASGAFFLNAEAHQNQPRHRLDASGIWTLLADNEPIKAGEAYWVFSKGMSQFDGPIEVQIKDGNFDFGTIVSEKQVSLINNSAFESVVKLDAGGFPLLAASESEGVITWTPASTLTQIVPAGGKATLRLGVQRAGLTAAVESTITVTAPGVSLPFPAKVSGDSASAAPPTTGFFARSLAAAAAPAVSPNGGLWVGQISLNKVNDVNGAPGVTVPTPAEFDLRFIVHVNASGVTKLLKQVVLMKKTVPVGQPATFVLITDDTRLPDFTGAVLKDGQPFGYRVSSIGFDFAGNELALTGAFGTSLAGSVVVDRTLATNPMKHRYHPDHDDLDAQFKPLPNPAPANSTPDQEEVWKITRNIALTFAAAPANPKPGDATVRTGTYSETIAGLHRLPLVVEGTFTLRRVNQLTDLNPAL